MNFKKYKMNLGVMVYSFNLSTRDAEEDRSECIASLVRRASSRTDRVMQRSPALETNKTEKISKQIETLS